MNKRLLFIAAMLVFLAGIVYAQTNPGDFLGSTSDAALKFFAELSRRLMFTGMIWTKINEMKYEVYNNLPDYLLKDPQINDPEVLSVISYFLKIIQPLSVTAVILIGFYLLFMSGSPEGRAQAKNLLLKLIAGIILITLFLPILRLLFTVSNTLTKNILALGITDSGFAYRRAVDYLTYRAVDFMWGNISVGLPFLLLSLAMTTGLFLMLAIRQFVLLFLMVFFPIALLLYLFNLTKNIGEIFLKQLLFWTFLPAGYALVLVTMSVSSQSMMFSSIELMDIVGLVAGLLILVSPVIMFIVVNWTVKIITSYTVMLEPVQQIVSDKSKKTTKETGPAAVGVGGYARVEEKKKEERKKDVDVAVGASGYSISQERKKEEKKAPANLREGISRYITTTRQALIPQRRTDEAQTISDGEETIALADILKGEVTREKGGVFEEKDNIKTEAKEFSETERKGVSAAAAIGSGGVHLAKATTPTAKEQTTSMSITKKPLGVIALELAPGESAVVETKILNDSKNLLFSVTSYDDGLSDAGFDVSYANPRFSLRIGEEKQLKIKISAPEGMKKGPYEGGRITFKSEKGTVATLEINILVGEQKAEKFGEVDESEVSFGRAEEGEKEKTKKRSELIKERNVFGEKVGKKDDGKKREGVKTEAPRQMPTIRTAERKAPEKEYAAEELGIQKSLETLGPIPSFQKKTKKTRVVRRKK